jgi:hypothetical protein
MINIPFRSALVLFTLMLPLASNAAAPEEETKFVDAVKKAFDEKKPAELSSLTCWDGISDEDKKKGEETYKHLVEEDVSFSFELVEADLKHPDKNGEPLRPNLKIVKQLDVHLIDSRDKKLLAILGFAVGEKDGKLLLVRTETAN